MHLKRWQLAWVLLAALTLAPVAYSAHKAMKETARDLRVQLIKRYSLWEADSTYRGTPQDWTRFAAMLLSERQLMQRLRALHASSADAIEQDFETDSVLAHAGVIASHVALWSGPLGALYLIGWLRDRRQRTRAPDSTVTDSRASSRPRA